MNYPIPPKKSQTSKDNPFGKSLKVCGLYLLEESGHTLLFCLSILFTHASSTMIPFPLALIEWCRVPGIW